MATFKFILYALLILAFKTSAQATTTAGYHYGGGSSGGGSSGGGSSGGGSSSGGSSGGGSSGGGTSGGGSSGGGSSGGGCAALLCPTCPGGYYMVHDNVNPCPSRCLCQLSESTTVSPGTGMSKSLLLSILHNIQNNADALEQMAKGLSDEADLAQNVAGLP